MAELLRVPPGFSQMCSDVLESSTMGRGTRADRRNATKMGRQCDDGGGVGGCGGPPPAMAWWGRGVVGIGGIPARLPGAMPGFVLSPGGLKLHDVTSS